MRASGCCLNSRSLKLFPGTKIFFGTIMQNYALSRKYYVGDGVPPMGPGDQYRVRALELRAMARCENNPGMRAEFEKLARAYMRLAEQAERNCQLDLTYETPIKKSEDGERP